MMSIGSVASRWPEAVVWSGLEALSMAGRMKMEWADGVARNIERIGALFPGCVTEARGADGRLRAAIDFERLRQELSDEARRQIGRASCRERV